MKKKQGFTGFISALRACFSPGASRIAARLELVQLLHQRKRYMRMMNTLYPIRLPTAKNKNMLESGSSIIRLKQELRELLKKHYQKMELEREGYSSKDSDIIKKGKT